MKPKKGDLTFNKGQRVAQLNLWLEDRDYSLESERLATPADLAEMGLVTAAKYDALREEYNLYQSMQPVGFENHIAAAINKFNKENDSNTPDWILAQYLCDCLEAFTDCSLLREKWYGKSLSINTPEPAPAEPEETPQFFSGKYKNVYNEEVVEVVEETFNDVIFEDTEGKKGLLSHRDFQSQFKKYEETPQPHVWKVGDYALCLDGKVRRVAQGMYRLKFHDDYEPVKLEDCTPVPEPEMPELPYGIKIEEGTGRVKYEDGLWVTLETQIIFFSDSEIGNFESYIIALKALSEWRKLTGRDI